MSKHHINGLLIVLVGILFLQFLWRGEGVVYSDYSDIISYFLSIKSTNQESISALEGVALWNPYMNSGQPLLANPQSMFLFPLNWTDYFLPLDKAINLTILLNYILAGLGMYVFCKNRFNYTQTSLVCAIGYMLSYRYLALIHSGHFSKMTIIALMPLLFWAYERICQKSCYKTVGIAALLTALSLMQGDMQNLYYSAGAILVMVIYKLLNNHHEQRVGLKCLGIFSAIALGLMLSAPILFPEVEYALLSSRTIKSYEFFKDLAPSWRDLKTILDPLDDMGKRNQYWESNFYFGIWLWPLILYTLAFGKNVYRWIAIGVVLICCLCFDNFIVKGLFQWLPGFSLFRQTPRMLFVAEFLLLIIAGGGLDLILGHQTQKKRWIFLGAHIFWAILIGAVFWVGGAAEDTLVMSSDVMLIGALLIGLGRFRKNIVLGVFCCLLIFDAGMRFLPRFETRSLENVYVKHPLHALLEKEESEFRVFGVGPWCIPYGMAGMYNIPMINAYSAINLKHYLSYLHIIEGNPLTQMVSKPTIVTSLSKIEKPYLFYALNVRYILANQHYPFEDFLRCKKIAYYPKVPVYDQFQGFILVPVHVWEVDNPIPDGYFASSMEIYVDDQNILKALVENTEGTKVFVKKGEVFQDDLDYTGGSIDLVYSGVNKYKYRINSAGNNFTVLSQVWYPGWRATVDGQKTVLYRTNHALIGCVIPPGEHKLILEMTSPWMQRGWMTFGCGILLMGLFYLFDNKKVKR